MPPLAKLSASTQASSHHSLSSSHSAARNSRKFFLFILKTRRLPLTSCRRMLGIPVLTLRVYLRFWSIMCYSVTVWLMFFKREVTPRDPLKLFDLFFFQDPVPTDDPDLNVKKVYSLMWRIVRLKRQRNALYS